MRGKLPIVLSAIALVVAVLGASSPAIAHGVQHALFAHNSDKVDGKHAVSSTATLNAAGGKLVATQASGPNKGKFARKYINSAYAFVSARAPTPAFDAARTRNFVSVTSPSTGEYCLKPAANISPATSPLVVSAEWSNSSGSDLLVYWRSSGLGCPAGEYDVVTYDLAGGTPTLSNDITFVAYVP
ncbi:MAG TPA: hypothetical protein VNO56_02450 [Gaiellaceae bacterium]|nr:hypothetical protein [Gaiellaceae bacterium]